MTQTYERQLFHMSDQDILAEFNSAQVPQGTAEIFLRSIRKQQEQGAWSEKQTAKYVNGLIESWKRTRIGKSEYNIGVIPITLYR